VTTLATIRRAADNLFTAIDLDSEIRPRLWMHKEATAAAQGLIYNLAEIERDGKPTTARLLRAAWCTGRVNAFGAALSGNRSQRAKNAKVWASQAREILDLLQQPIEVVRLTPAPNDCGCSVESYSTDPGAVSYLIGCDTARALNAASQAALKAGTDLVAAGENLETVAFSEHDAAVDAFRAHFGGDHGYGFYRDLAAV
jgi:hypothetical protein